MQTNTAIVADYGKDLTYYRARIRAADTFGECWDVFRELKEKPQYETLFEEALKKTSLNATNTQEFIAIYHETDDVTLMRICLRGARRVAASRREIDAVVSLVDINDSLNIKLCKKKRLSINKQVSREVINQKLRSR